MSPHNDDPILVGLATRIPKRLAQAVKVHCVETDTPIKDFVTDALRARLAKAGHRLGRQKRAKGN